jgi:5-oxoprolinase (ATP-hydrolysing)
MRDPTHPWRIHVDTGGTFTDCLAVDPVGRVHRAKVLSSSSLRGVLAAPVEGDTVRTTPGWGGVEGLGRGARFRLLGEAGEGTEVLEHRAAVGVLRLATPLAGRCEAGEAFELLFAEPAPVLAARLLTGTPAGAPLPPLEMRLGTTRGTNALLERRGAPTALFVNTGFADVLRIGTQQRPELFTLDPRRPPPLAEHVVEVPGRLDAAGLEIEPLRLDEVAPRVRALVRAGVRSAAVALLHSYRDPSHERALGRLLRELGMERVSLSGELAPAIRLYPRAQTAAVDAYLAPVVRDYLEAVEAAIGGGGSRLLVMTSASGLARPASFAPKDSLLSGPAGGVVGAAAAGRASGHPRVIAFDMGGTSTDVARVDGEHAYVWEHAVGGVSLLAPALAIESVAAGGGSICRHDALGLRVGPESAGAWPGPACYGAGGPLTLTDVNLLLGRLDPARFGIPVDRAAAAAALDALREALRGEHGGDAAALPDAIPLLDGLLEIADERMADAIRGISLREGYDPAEYALVAFGGAGAQHACGVATRLGMETVLVPADAGLLSAVGIGHAAIERLAERQVLRRLDEVEPELPALLAELEESARASVRGEGVAEEAVDVRRRIAELRFLGQDSTLSVEYDSAGSLAPLFHERYLEVFGHLPEERPVEVESLRVIAASTTAEPEPAAAVRRRELEPAGTHRCWTGSAWEAVPAFERERLPPGSAFAGPALVWERHSSTWVPPGWEARVDGAAALVLRRTSDGAGPGGRVADGGRPAAVVEELFTSRFTALVAEMGEQLQRTALSTNVKERLDFSCALLGPDGELVVNAPHIPVHLGALGECVRAVRQALPLRPGDVAVTNHPAFGGSHLPDVTVITPVHGEGGELLGYVASRAHHAEIGGTRPGSMPPDARTLIEEGVVIAPRLLLAGGEPRWEEIRTLLEGAAFPSRDPESNLADLRAQVAANQRGTELLKRLAAAHGRAPVHEQMRRLTARAERRVTEALRGRAGRHEAVERLDDGSELRVSIEVSDGRAIFDFAGSAGTHPGNLNATPAIVRSAVLYVLRLLVDEPIPLNEGLMRRVELRIPRGLLNPEFPADPARAPAVVGGNIEVSQRLVDTLIRALGLAACSQGTMNNVLWGNASFGYYETVAGGAGAGPGWAGASALHTHMTNTRITDVEVLEHRYPVRVERFAVRTGSGGAGEWHGGDGVVREIRFLQPMSLSLLAQHRVERPYGMAGGEAGAPGRQRVVRADGEVLELRGTDACEVQPGDRLVLETPGGGGWGRPPPSS